MGVVFFPSLLFMGVMLFPSFGLGNASGGGGTLLVPPSLFFIFFLFLSFLLLLLPFLFSSTSHSPFSLSFRTNSFHPFSSSHLFHLFPFLLLHFILSFFHVSFTLFLFLPHKLLPSFFFLRELLVLCASKM